MNVWFIDTSVLDHIVPVPPVSRVFSAGFGEGAGGGWRRPVVVPRPGPVPVPDPVAVPGPVVRVVARGPGAPAPGAATTGPG